MKRLTCLFLTVLLLLAGCAQGPQPAQVAATTLPVYEFAAALCSGTDIRVTRVITQEVSCLHDFSLQVDQTRAVEAAQVLIVSGAGLDGFIAELAPDKVLDASKGIALHCNESHHDHNGHHDQDHHQEDPHIWLSIENARLMAQNICTGLTVRYPAHKRQILANMESLQAQFDELEAYGKSRLEAINSRKIVTFHDGFSYLAEDWNIEILKAIEEESGSEASAATLIEIIRLVEDNRVKALFTETNGSTGAAAIISRETGVPVYRLDMAMSGESWFSAMRHNYDTLKEALE